MDKIDDRIDEKEAFYDGLIEGYQKGSAELRKGKDITIGDIRSFARDIGGFEKAREEARNKESRPKLEQQRKVKSLLEKGYRPQLIRKFDPKGQPKETEISFYNPKTGDFAKLNIKLETKDVSKLRPSKLGRVPTKQQIELAGKKFDFQTNKRSLKL